MDVLVHRAALGSCASALGAGEVVVELARSSSRVVRAVHGEVEQECTVLGYYQSYNGLCKGRGACVRRATGGASLRTGRNWYYVAMAWRDASSLGEVYEKAAELASCLYGRVRGPVVVSGDVVAVVGVTRYGGVGFAEIIGLRPPRGSVADCLRAHGPVSERTLPKGLAEARGRRYRARSWVVHGFPSSVTSTARKCTGSGFWARLGVEVVDGYIAGWGVEGVFYSAPPAELYSVLASVKGTPFHELTLDSIIAALEARVELYGVGVEAFKEMFEDLYGAAGLRLYTRG